MVSPDGHQKSPDYALSCLASTKSLYCGPVASTCDGWDDKKSDLQSLTGRPWKGAENNCFRNAEWTADGTTIITYSEDWRLRSFIAYVSDTQSACCEILTHTIDCYRPTNLLDATKTPKQLTPYSTCRPIKSSAVALYPLYNLNEPNTTAVLQSQDSLPIRLTNALDLNFTQASYPWISPTTEQYIAPNSLVFTPDGSHFIAGAKERLGIFDLARDGEGPVCEYRTIRTRYARKHYGRDASAQVGGLVFSLAISCDEVLAGGSTTGDVGLWTASGQGESITGFNINDQEGEGKATCHGVGQLVWSPCGRYLLIAERRSDSIHVYDIRGASKRVSCLTGRAADITMPLRFALRTTPEGGLAVWAGGTDGRVRVWEDVLSREGVIEADWSMEVHQGEHYDTGDGS